MRTLLAIAWRNVLRNRRRSLLTATAMAIAVVVVSMMLVLVEGMYGQMRDVVIDRTLGHVQIHHEDYPGRRQMFDALDDLGPTLETLDALPEVEAVGARLFGSALLGGEERTEGVQLVGILPSREATLRDLAGRVVDGAWLDDAPAGAVVLGADLAEELRVGLGDEVVAVTQAADGSLGNVLYEVIGTVRVGVPSLDRGAAYVHLDDLGQLLALQGRAHELVVIGSSQEPGVIEDLRDAVVSALGARPAVVRPWWEVDPSVQQVFALQDLTAWILIVFFFGVSAVGVVNTLLMSVLERTREIGVMRALGLRPREVVAMVLLEALVLASLATGVGLVIALIGDAYLVTQGIDFSIGGRGYELGAMTFDPIVKGRLHAAALWQPALGVFGFSLLAAIWPAMRAAGLRPVDALRSN